jgi:hypothetical protein
MTLLGASVSGQRRKGDSVVEGDFGIERNGRENGATGNRRDYACDRSGLVNGGH